MKAQEHNWEEALRQQVEQHEFDFDPQAWEEMEALLDNAVLPPPDPKLMKGKPGWWYYGKWGLLGLLLIAGIVLWQMRQGPSQRVSLDGFTIVVPPPVPEVIEAPAVETDAVINEVVAVMTKSSRKPVPEEVTASEKERIDTLETPILAIEKMAPVTPISGQKLPAKIHFRKTDKKALTPPEPPKRKRNRRKLFPDVFDNY